jgi:hypothetical protein
MLLLGCGAGTVDAGPDAGIADDGGSLPAFDANQTGDTDASDPCTPIDGVTYASLTTDGPMTDRPAAQHADLNVKLRGWSSTGGALGLVDINGPTDTNAPRIDSMFAPDRVPSFAANYRVNDWDWTQNAAAGPITEWDVTLTSAVTMPGEVIETPRAGYDIGEGHVGRVLYADDDSITIKYTREDNIVFGYAVHLVGICVEPSLRDAYQLLDAAGRVELPALRPEQPIGRARSTTVDVAIRDTGAFMDPRARKDWWE